jgi:hypothetical protein
MPRIECELRGTDHKSAGISEGARWTAELSRLLQLPDEKISALDIADLNLFCAVGLPGTENVDNARCLRQNDGWTRQVRQFTGANWYRFLGSPGEFGNSPGHFKMLAMVTVLQRDLGVRYYLPFSEGAYNGSDSRNLFIHGLLSGHGGTCVTMPVLDIAVGRRLGYPLSLVRSKEHYFVRWEDAHERFNIEAACQGFAPHDDEHFRHLPKPAHDAEIAAGVYLRSLRPREELATFLDVRGSCLLYNLRIPEALRAVKQAAALSPTIPLVALEIRILTTLVHAMCVGEIRAFQTGRHSIDLRKLSFPPPRSDQQYWANDWASKRLRKVLAVSTCDPVIPLPIHV